MTKKLVILKGDGIGPEIVREFLVSTGYLKGAHSEDCPTAERAAAANPPWLRG